MPPPSPPIGTLLGIVGNPGNWCSNEPHPIDPTPQSTADNWTFGTAISYRAVGALLMSGRLLGKGGERGCRIIRHGVIPSQPRSGSRLCLGPCFVIHLDPSIFRLDPIFLYRENQLFCVSLLPNSSPDRYQTQKLTKPSPPPSPLSVEFRLNPLLSRIPLPRLPSH